MGKMVKLFPHNQISYFNTVEMLKEKDRACIIQPTGTGKAVIVSKFIEENPLKNHLVLAPGSHIEDEIKKHVKGVFSFSTYQNLLYNLNEITAEFDYIYLDEFHRCGAKIWGNEIRKLLLKNPNAKIIGTSATHIRFLDGGRNMANEFFFNNISNHISLNQAIEKEILPAPVYVASIYNLENETKNLIEKVRNSLFKNKEKLIDKIKESTVAWERSQGVNQIINKHLTLERKRIIVFCSSKHQLNQIKILTEPAFRKKFSNVKFYEVYSGFNSKKNQKTIADFAEKGDVCKILYSIDKLNEGLHVKDTQTVILFRQTRSPIIYYQQIGRAFETNSSLRPLIIDFVNNFNQIITKSHESDFGGNSTEAFLKSSRNVPFSRNKKVTFIDETKEIREIFRAFSDTIERWEIMFQHAKNFFKKNGHLRPTTNIDHKLHYWLKVQRSQQACGKLSNNRFKKLSSIGIDWNLTDAYFFEMVEEYKKFFKKYSRTPMRTENKQLYHFINQKRTLYNKKKLSDEQFSFLKDLPKFFHTTKKVFTSRLEKLIKFLNDNPNITINDVEGLNCEFSTFVKNQRLAHQRGIMTLERKKIFENLGIVWNRNEEVKKNHLKILEDNFKKNGELPKRGSTRRYVFTLKEKLDKKQIKEKDIKDFLPYIKLVKTKTERAIENHIKTLQIKFKQDGNIKSKHGDSVTIAKNYLRKKIKEEELNNNQIEILKSIKFI